MGSRALAIGLVMAVTMNAFEAMAVVTAMPAVADDLNGDALYGVAFSAYMLANLVSLVAAGEQADRHGPARPFLLGVASFAVGLVVAGLAPAMPIVVLGRVLQGAGAGALASVSYVAVGRAWPPARQPRMFALLSAAWVVPSLIAPAAAGLLTENYGWRWVFLALLPILPVLVVLALPSLRAIGPPTVAPSGAPSRVPKALLLAGGVGLAVTGLAAEKPYLIVPITLLGAAIATRPLMQLLPRGSLRAAVGLPAAVASRFLVNMAFFGTDTFVPLAATRIHGASTAVAGAVLIGASLTWTLGSVLCARNSDRWRPGAVVRVGFVVVAIAIALTMPILNSSSPLWVFFLTWTIPGLGIGFVFNTTAVVAMGGAEAGREGVVSSQLQMADGLGFAIIGGIGGALVGYADRTGASLASVLTVQFALSFGVAVVGIVVGGRVAASRPARAGRVAPAPAA